jgi:hypothetical protein
MTTLSPAFPSSGVSLSSLGASPKQEGAVPAVSAEANFGAVVFEEGVRLPTFAGFFSFFSCLAGSAAQVPVGLIAARQIATTPIATVILKHVVPLMTDLHVFADRNALSLITGFEAG